MKNYLTRLFCLFVVGAVLIFAIGCSDSDNPVVPPGGSSTDANFQFIQNSIGDDSFDASDIDFEISLTLLGLYPTPTSETSSGSRGEMVLASLAAGVDTIIVDSVGFHPPSSAGWYVFNFKVRVIELLDTAWASGIDSIRLTQDTASVIWIGPNTVFNGIQIRNHATWFNNDSDSGVIHHGVDMNLNVVGTDSLGIFSATLNDTAHVTDITDSVSCDVDIAQNIIFDSLVILINESSTEICPRSGNLTVTANLSLNCTSNGGLNSLGVEGTWTITAVVNDDNTISYTYTDGTTTWRVTESCSPPV